MRTGAMILFATTLSIAAPAAAQVSVTAPAESFTKTAGQVQLVLTPGP
jgi:hypothetical protein